MEFNSNHRLIFLFSLIFAILSLGSESKAREKYLDNKDICDKQKGVWREFGDDCANNCHAKNESINICGSNIVYGCDCGEKKCWDDIHEQCLYVGEYETKLNKAQEDEKKLEEKKLAESKKEEGKKEEGKKEEGKKEEGKKLEENKKKPEEKKTEDDKKNEKIEKTDDKMENKEKKLEAGAALVKEPLKKEEAIINPTSDVNKMIPIPIPIPPIPNNNANNI